MNWLARFSALSGFLRVRSKLMVNLLCLVHPMTRYVTVFICCQKMGGFDLSVGSVQVLTAIVVASLLSVVGPPLAILGAVLTGLAIGLLNGVLISKLRLPAFVVTFGMMSVIRGVALLVT
jgi:ribose transport system permease protein